MNPLYLIEKAFGFHPEVQDLRLLLSIKECCDLLGISRATFYRRQKVEGFPRKLKNGRRSHVRRADLVSWANGLKSDV